MFICIHKHIFVLTYSLLTPTTGSLVHFGKLEDSYSQNLGEIFDEYEISDSLGNTACHPPIYDLI
jgi:hypothetical protein